MIYSALKKVGNNFFKNFFVFYLYIKSIVVSLQCKRNKKQIQMNVIAKQKVKEHLSTEYGKQMVEIYGLKYIKKEIYQAIKTYTLGDKREQKCY